MPWPTLADNPATPPPQRNKRRGSPLADNAEHWCSFEAGGEVCGLPIIPDASGRRWYHVVGGELRAGVSEPATHGAQP